MYKQFQCICGYPFCKIEIYEASDLDKEYGTYYLLKYPVHYEQFLNITGQKNIFTIFFNAVKTFFINLKLIFINNIFVEYDLILKTEDFNELVTYDTELKSVVDNNENIFINISNKVWINISKIPFFVLLNFLFKGYISGDYYKFLDKDGISTDDNYIDFKIF